MKFLTIIIFLTTILNAGVHIEQNMKALYRGIDLTTYQENYILDNQEETIILMQNIGNALMKEQKRKKKFIREKNVIEFVLTPLGEIKKFKYLKRSSKRKFDKITKEIVKEAKQGLIKPERDVRLRYIIKYEYGKKKVVKKRKSVPSKAKTERYQRIPKGTSRFLYSSKEYVRTFEVRKDGYMNITNQVCADIKILTMQNQRVRTGVTSWNINAPIKKGKYKMLIQTKKKCDIHVQYP